MYSFLRFFQNMGKQAPFTDHNDQTHLTIAPFQPAHPYTHCGIDVHV